MNTVQRFKQRKIQKAQLGTLLKKGWNQLSNLVQASAIVESPSVMTASGWRIDRNGKAKQNQQNTKEIKQLRNNLATIGEAGVTAPTLVGDVGALYNAVRHPVQTGKAVWKAGQDALWFLRNPRAVKVYHGSRENFNLNQARTASRNNIGIHVSPKKQIAEKFGENGGYVKSAYIPKHNMETIDIGANDYRLISNDLKLSARPSESTSFYDAAGNPKLFYKLLQEQGANPSYKFNPWFTSAKKVIHTENNVSIPLRNKTWKNISSKANEEAEQILSDANFSGLKTKEEIENKAIQLNQRANDLLSKNNKKVIKYNNTNPYEGGGGTSYIITDPSVFYNPQKYNWEQIINRTKYPIMYGTNQ